RRHTRSTRDWSSDVCSSDLGPRGGSPALSALCSSSRVLLSMMSCSSSSPIRVAEEPSQRGQQGRRLRAQFGERVEGEPAKLYFAGRPEHHHNLPTVTLAATPGHHATLDQTVHQPDR